jgi:hypothetical protein
MEADKQIRWDTALKAEIILHRAIETLGPRYSARLVEVNNPTEKSSAHRLLIQRKVSYQNLTSFIIHKRRDQMSF